MTLQVERLAALGIELMTTDAMPRHVVFSRGGYAALVERREGSLGRVGASGLVTERGLAMLVWREEHAFFVAKGGWEQPASGTQIEELRQFSSDLERVLRAC